MNQKSPQKHIWKTLLTIFIAALVAGGGVYSWQTIEGLEDQVDSLESVESEEASSVQEPESIPAQPSQEESSIEAITYKYYESSEYDFSFTYPSSYEIVNEEVVVAYLDGSNWFRVELQDFSSPENPFLRFEVDPDGYGPFFPDKTYKISEKNSGELVLDAVVENDSASADDGKVLIIPDILKAENGHRYNWQFSFSEGGEDHEKVFKQMLGSFKFY